MIAPHNAQAGAPIVFPEMECRHFRCPAERNGDAHGQQDSGEQNDADQRQMGVVTGIFCYQRGNNGGDQGGDQGGDNSEPFAPSHDMGAFVITAQKFGAPGCIRKSHCRRRQIDHHAPEKQIDAARVLRRHAEHQGRDKKQGRAGPNPGLAPPPAGIEMVG